MRLSRATPLKRHLFYANGLVAFYVALQLIEINYQVVTLDLSILLATTVRILFLD